MDKNLTRKEFLVNSSKVAIGLTAVAGMTSLVTNAAQKSGGASTAWPWPYQTLDLEQVRIQAHNLYWNGLDCGAGTFGALKNALADAIGAPWTDLPNEILLFGRGGGSGWGSLCGTLAGGAALISLVTAKTPSGPLITELWGWYTQANLPTDTANQFATENKYLVHNYDAAIIQNVSGSPLCHVSVTEWCVTAQKKVSDVERKERCARITGDIAVKTAELLNAYFANQFTPTYVDPATVQGCLGCHGTAFMNNVMTKLECTSCHGTSPHGSSVKTIPGTASTFELSQNYPNPFNPNTKIKFSIPKSEKVKLEVYDIRGNLIKTLVDYETYQPGMYEVDWDGLNNIGSRVASGIYFTKIQAGDFVQTRKMNFLK